MKLKKLVKESWLEEPKTLTTEEKKMFLEKVKGFNNYSKKIFRAGRVSETAKELAEMCKMAEVLTLSEVDESFDKITVNRNMKELSNLSKSFLKTSEEADILESRLKTLYDDMGRLFERYYEVDDVEEMMTEELPAQHVDKSQGKKPYDNWHANDAGSKQPPKQSFEMNEELPAQHVEQGQGLKPYDNWHATDVGSAPKEEKSFIQEKKTKK